MCVRNKDYYIPSCMAVIPNPFINAEPYTIFNILRSNSPTPTHIYFYQLKQKIYIKIIHVHCTS